MGMCSESTDQLTRGKGTDTEPTPGLAVERKLGRVGLMAYYQESPTGLAGQFGGCTSHPERQRA